MEMMFPFFGGMPLSEQQEVTPLSLDVVREVLAAHLPRIVDPTRRLEPGQEIIQPSGAQAYTIGSPECPAVFVRYLGKDEIRLEDGHGEVDCLVSGVNSGTVGVWPVASWRFVPFTGEEPERALTKLSEFCVRKFGLVTLADVRELFPLVAEATRWFYSRGWSRDLRRLGSGAPEVVFLQKDPEGRCPRVVVTIIDGVVEAVSAEGEEPIDA